MRQTALRLILLCMFIAWLSSAANAAKNDLVIIVVDDASNLPLVHARVSVVGTNPGESAVGYTDAAGVVRIASFRPGAVRIFCSAQEYSAIEMRIDISDDPDLESYPLTIELSKYKTIGQVAASKSAAAERSVGDADALRRVSPDLIDALSRLGGVSIVTSDNTFSVSLAGRDPSQTSYTIDGTPVGVNAGQLSIDSDLLQSATVGSAQDSVALSLLSPTQELVEHASGTIGNYGTSVEKASIQGSIGDLGFAAAHVERGVDSLLDNETYQDLSGLTYRHVGQIVRIGDFVKLAVPVGDWSLSLADAISRSAGTPLSNYYAGSEPAGIGPGERKTSNAENWIFVANGSVLGIPASFNASSWSYRDDDDQLNRVIERISAPLRVDDNVSGRSVQGYMSFSTGDHSTTELLGTLTSTGTSSGVVDLGMPSYNTVSAGEQSLRVTERLRTNENRDIVSYATIVSDGRSALPEIHLQELLRRGNSSRMLEIGYARKPIHADDPENIRSLLDPKSASYDCNDAIITAQVPGATVAQPAVLGADASLASHAKMSFAQISGYFEYQRGLLLTNAAVPATAQSGSPLQGYINSLQSDYGTVGGCSPNLIAPDVFFLQTLSGVSARYDGIDIAGGTSLGRRLQLSGDFAFQQAIPIQLPPALLAADSYYAVGRQLPNVPYFNGTATVDWQLADRVTEVLGNASLTSINNKSNLPEHVVYSIALQRTLSKQLSFLILSSNILNAFSGKLVTAQHAVPYVLSNGAVQPALAAPESPRRFFMTIIYKNR